MLTWLGWVDELLPQRRRPCRAHVADRRGRGAASDRRAGGGAPAAVGPELRRAAPVGRRPRVFLNMACTADGRATLEGRSGPIGNRADKELFLALRTAVDAVLVGAGTARTERYRRLVKDESQRRLRLERGLAEEPLACIVSASLALSPESVPLLGDPAARVVILTPSAAGVLPAADSAELPPPTRGRLPADTPPPHSMDPRAPRRAGRSGRVRAHRTRRAARSAGRARRAARPVGGADRDVRGGSPPERRAAGRRARGRAVSHAGPQARRRRRPAGLAADRVRAGARPARRAGAARGARERGVPAAALSAWGEIGSPPPAR